MHIVPKKRKIAIAFLFGKKNAQNCYCISLWKEKCAKLLLPFSVGKKRTINVRSLSALATREQKMCAGKLGKTIGRGQARRETIGRERRENSFPIVLHPMTNHRGSRLTLIILM